MNQKPTQSAPPTDEYTTGFQIRPTLVLNKYSPLLAPLMTEEAKPVSNHQNPQRTEHQTVKHPLGR